MLLAKRATESVHPKGVGIGGHDGIAFLTCWHRLAEEAEEEVVIFGECEPPLLSAANPNYGRGCQHAG